MDINPAIFIIDSHTFVILRLLFGPIEQQINHHLRPPLLGRAVQRCSPMSIGQVNVSTCSD